MMEFTNKISTNSSGSKEEGLLTVILVILIIVAVIVVLAAIYVIYLLRTILHNERGKIAAVEGFTTPRSEGSWQKILRSLTRSTPISEERAILLDHNYDGIRELDNHLPPWWKALFYITIVWAAFYLLTFHVFDFFPLSEEEYKLEITRAETELNAKKSLFAEDIDENTVEFIDDAEILANGEVIFKTHCVVCHAADGGGGVGPNLTDNYWLHGGSINNIFWVIKYGVPVKGMISWQSQLSSVNIRDVASYIVTLKGTIPANPREPQGELYDENKVVENIENEPDLRPTIKDVRDSLDNIQIGRGLFCGTIRLFNEGPGCITCHNVTEEDIPKGALIAPDLTNVYTRLDEQTILKYATEPYHAVMQAAYKGKPVVEEEAGFLIAFFQYVGTSTSHQQQRDERAAGFLNRIKKQ
jgi:cytochrome c oxidase cbb3-type subunit 3